HVDGLDVASGVGVEQVEQAFLAAGDDYPAQLAVDLDAADHPVEHPVEVILVVLHVLEVPLELARARDEGERRVGEQRVVVHPRLAVAQGPGVVTLRHAPQREAALRVVSTGSPLRAAAALLGRDPVPAVAAGLPGLGYGLELPQFLAGLGV